MNAAGEIEYVVILSNAEDIQAKQAQPCRSRCQSQLFFPAEVANLRQKKIKHYSILMHLIVTAPPDCRLTLSDRILSETEASQMLKYSMTQNFI